jgi:DNA (cytosine-5)-methyltransferase 1
VTGVDIEETGEYPFTFVKADAVELLTERRAWVQGFDLVCASPPCQGFTAYKRRRGHVAPCANLIPDVRLRLGIVGGLHVIENVPGAPLIEPVTLCGSMFGLDVRRHRLFESNFTIPQPACNHRAQAPRFPPATNRANLRRTVEVGVWRIPLEVQQAAMGIDWMALENLSQAIPPAYAEHIGRAALAAMQQKEAA